MGGGRLGERFLGHALRRRDDGGIVCTTVGFGTPGGVDFGVGGITNVAWSYEID